MWVFAIDNSWSLPNLSQFILDHWQDGVAIFGQNKIGQGIVSFDILNDLDRDGLPDPWEQQYWGNITTVDNPNDD